MIVGSVGDFSTIWNLQLFGKDALLQMHSSQSDATECPTVMDIVLSRCSECFGPPQSGFAMNT
eukprot:6415631-Amphidinium_carterae.1